MATLKVPTESQEAWLKSGAPTEALDFLSNVTEKMSKKAKDENRLFKEFESDGAMNEENVGAIDINPVNSEVVEEIPTATETVPVEEASETGGQVADEPTGEVGEVDQMKQFLGQISDYISKSIVSALSEYHSTVATPAIEQAIQKNLAVKQPEKATQLGSFTVTDFLPPAALSQMLAKEFNITNDVPNGATPGDKTMQKDTVVDTVITEVTPTEKTEQHQLSGI